MIIQSFLMFLSSDLTQSTKHSTWPYNINNTFKYILLLICARKFWNILSTKYLCSLDTISKYSVYQIISHSKLMYWVIITPHLFDLALAFSVGTFVSHRSLLNVWQANRQPFPVSVQAQHIFFFVQKKEPQMCFPGL